VTYSVLEDNERALSISTKWSIDGQELRSRSWKMK